MNLGDLVLYKNNQLIAFNKPVGIPVQSDKTGDKTLLNLAEIYCKSTLYLTHRLDRPAGGVVLFAKTKTALRAINAQFQERSIQKVYWAVVKQLPEHPEGELVHYLRKDQQKNRSIAFEKEVAHAKKSSLIYKILTSSTHYHLLEIKPETGRHHQIRAQLAAINCPIKGDTKYGFKRSNPDRSIHLHARQLIFHHPISKQKESIIAELKYDDPVWNALKNNLD